MAEKVSRDGAERVIGSAHIQGSTSASADNQRTGSEGIRSREKKKHTDSHLDISGQHTAVAYSDGSLPESRFKALSL